jgi:hypothetical protein
VIQSVNTTNPKPKNQPQTQRTKFSQKYGTPASLHFISFFCHEHFWTYLDFFGLFQTQPANKSNPKLKKQLKTQRTEHATKHINNLIAVF